MIVVVIQKLSKKMYTYKRDNNDKILNKVAQQKLTDRNAILPTSYLQIDGILSQSRV